ncbi:MAG: beta-cystathionase [Rubripirellula sp.]
MSLLKQSTGQARDAFAAMPMQSRIISVMLVAAIAIGLAFLVRGTEIKRTQMLFGGRSLSEQELDAIEVALSTAGLNEWERDGRRIAVPNETKSDYFAALQEASSLPVSLRTRVDEAIKASSPFDSSDLRHSREMHAKEQDLGNKVATFPDVRWASVEYDRGERVGLSRATPQAASVVVQPEGSAPLPRQRILAIKELIRGSYAGMSSDDVVVIDTNGTASTSHMDEDDPLLRKQREAEARIEQKVRALLVGYPARVAVSAQIDPTMEVEKTTLKYDAEPTNLTNRTTKIESTRTQQALRGVPGTVTNAIGNRAASIEDGLEADRVKEDQRETIGVAGQQFENSKLAALQVKTVRVSVGLPTSYYDTLHARDFLKREPEKSALDVPPLDDSTLEKLRTKTEKNIQSAITVLLPEVSAGADRFPLVEVWDYPDIPGAPQVEPQAAKQAMTWLAESWQTLALVLLGFVALLVARSAAKGSGEPAPKEFQQGFGLEMPAPPPEPENPVGEIDRMTITGGSLKDELLTLVEGNPEVAANVIRGWVGEAA